MESYLLLAENGSEVRIWMIISILYFMKSEIEKEIFFLVCNRQDWATKQQWIIKKIDFTIVPKISDWNMKLYFS